jgi:hypothetical protein
MIAWMVYSALVTSVIAAAARAAESLARISGYRVRWIWAGALFMSVFLSGSSLARRGRAATTSTPGSSIAVTKASKIETVDASWRVRLKHRVDNVRRSLDVPLRQTIASVRRTVPAGVDMYAAVFASLSSFSVGLLLIAVASRFRSARRRWPATTVQGIVVRVAPRVGPVVIGLVHPDIIVPQWLLERRADDQCLVVTHEDEHVRARDPLLLGLAWMAVIVTPWNPLVWYMMSRLRLGVELDCDARVLRRGAAPRPYASLLIDVAQHASALRLSALALADDSSHLEQRILAMKPNVPRFARLRSGFAAVFALTGAVVACQATLPTDAEIARMDVASATQVAEKLAAAKHADTLVTYTVDGMTATRAEASAIPAATVARVEIVTGSRDNATRINVRTRNGTKERLNRVVNDSGQPKHVETMLRAEAEVTQGAAVEGGKPPFTGLIFIDGVRATDAQMKTLRADQIESVEVIKGAAAALYSDPQAASGVITIKTKRKGTN